MTIDPADYALEDFEALLNLEMMFNADPLDALRDFATADVLILSASSFGYLGDAESARRGRLRAVHLECCTAGLAGCRRAWQPEPRGGHVEDC